MVKNKEKKFIGQWVLIDRKSNIIFHSSDIVEVVKEGRKYPLGKVDIEKQFEEGSCFF